MTYSLQSQLNSNYLQQVYGFEMVNYLPWGVIINNNFTYTANTGRADGFNVKSAFLERICCQRFLKE